LEIAKMKSRLRNLLRLKTRAEPWKKEIAAPPHADDAKEGYARPQDEAIRLTRPAASQGEEYDRGEDFVPLQDVFFELDLLRILDRRNRVNHSWNTDNRPSLPSAA
jgi:hypothetical protein